MNEQTNVTDKGYTYAGKNYLNETRYDANNQPYQVAIAQGSVPTVATKTSPTVVSNYNTQSKVNDITATHNNNVSTSVPQFPTGTQRAVYAPTDSSSGQTGAFLGYASTPQEEQNLISSFQGSSTGQTSFTAPQEAVLQPDGTYLYQGQYYTRDQLSSPENLAAISNTSLQQKKYDQALQSELDAINKRYDQYRIEQQAINQGQVAGTQNALLQSGAGSRGSVAQYAAASADSRVSGVMAQGQRALAELDSQRDQLLSQAKIAYQDKNYKLLSDLNSKIEKNRQDMLEVTKEANKKLAEETAQAKKDNAISSIYEEVGNNTPAILSRLKEKGITNISSKDIASFLKNSGADEINSIAQEAAKNGASLGDIAKITSAGSVAEATAIASPYMKDPLDTAYKKAQIAKIYRDIRDSGVSSIYGDPSQIVAYAQQYASTGQIPTGIPKGSFGVIAQVAKELPKQYGEIVSTATNVKPTGDTTYTDALGNLGSVLTLAKQLKELDKNRIGGVAGGTLGYLTGSEDQAAYVATRDQIVDLLSRARSGAALTVSEEKRYGNMLPTRFSEKFGLGVNSDVQIDNFINTIQADLKNKAAAKGLSVYGVTKVKVNGQEYTVGDIVDNGTQKGRINADGSITIIQ